MRRATSIYGYFPTMPALAGDCFRQCCAGAMVPNASAWVSTGWPFYDVQASKELFITGSRWMLVNLYRQLMFDLYRQPRAKFLENPAHFRGAPPPGFSRVALEYE